MVLSGETHAVLNVPPHSLSIIMRVFSYVVVFVLTCRYRTPFFWYMKSRDR